MEQLTIGMTPQRQQQIDRYCALAGISQNKVIDEMWDLWERLVYIPQTDFVEKEERRLKAWEAFRRQRERVERGETPDMSMEDIIEEIKRVREERRSEKAML